MSTAGQVFEDYEPVVKRRKRNRLPPLNEDAIYVRDPPPDDMCRFIQVPEDGGVDPTLVLQLGGPLVPMVPSMNMGNALTPEQYAFSDAAAMLQAEIPARARSKSGHSRCEHKRAKAMCRDCNGSQICPHDRFKRQCKACGGKGICPHGRQKPVCADCGGSQICEHRKQKRQCKHCKGSQMCPHSRLKAYCKECGGSQICPHDRQKSVCVECGGSQICEHRKQRRQCRECMPVFSSTTKSSTKPTEEVSSDSMQSNSPAPEEKSRLREV